MIEWPKVKKLTSQEYDNLIQLFEECFALCLPSGGNSLDLTPLLMSKARESSEARTSFLTATIDSSLVESCLPLFQNLVLFEAGHGDIDRALALIDRYVSACPKVAELWMLYARLVCTEISRSQDPAVLVSVSTNPSQC